MTKRAACPVTLPLALPLALLVAFVVAAAAPAPARAVGWNDSELGDFYPVADVEDVWIRDAARAVVFFGNATGFVISADGYILTNHHVYESFGAAGTVRLGYTDASKGRKLKVKLVARDASVDAALYQAVDADGLPFLTLRADGARVGEEVFLVGHPSSDPQRVSFGKILATGLEISGRPSVEYSAQTWWGSSGSPVMDRAGRVIALHWGWDEEGLSHGRLTGVPIGRVAGAIAEVQALLTPKAAAEAIEEEEEQQQQQQQQQDRCADATTYHVKTTLARRGKPTKARGQLTAARVLDEVQVVLASDEPRCLARLEAVTWQLHPTFSPSHLDGDAATAGFPIRLRAWGFFATRADVRLAGGTTLAVAGTVRWRR